MDAPAPDPTQERLCVAFCIDRAFFKHAVVAVASLLDSGQSMPCDVRIFYSEFDPACAQEITRLFAGRAGDTCRLEPVSLEKYAAFPATDSISIGAYARLLLPYLMPEHARVLYLDADLLVLDDLADFWRLDMGDNALAAVPDPLFDNRQALGFTAAAPYFNSGVLLMNLDVWRRDAVAERIGLYIEQHGESLKYFDQDALNVVLAGRVRFTDLRWNFQPRMADLSPSDLACSPSSFDRTRRDPAIVHYTTPHKPWKDPFAIHYGQRYLDRLARLDPGFRAHHFADIPRRRALRLAHLKTSLRWRFPQVYRGFRKLLRPAQPAL